MQEIRCQFPSFFVFIAPYSSRITFIIDTIFYILCIFHWMELFSFVTGSYIKYVKLGRGVTLSAGEKQKRVKVEAYIAVS